MIPLSDIERFNEIVDREISLLELRDNMNKKLQERLIENWLFIKETFRKVCLDCAIAEGLIEKIG